MLTLPEFAREAALPHRLATALPGWLAEIPLYRQTAWSPRTDASMASFQRLPQITKREIRNNFPHNFLRPGVDLTQLLEDDLVEVEHTSGTSEERTSLILQLGWWDKQEERALRLNPLVAEVLDSVPAVRRVTISSPVCNGDVCFSGVPPRSERIVGQTLYASLSRHPFLWSDADLARIASETAEWQPHFLDVDPVYGVIFARYCERHGIRLPSLRFILCSYEFVSVVHRQILQRAFGVPVFNLYGSTETGHLLMENQRGQMIPSSETAYLEVVEPDAHGIGQLVVTTLTNDYMPLIRYRIGDLVERTNQSFRVHGRAMDALTTAEGRRVTVWQLDQCFKGLPGIAHYQLVHQPDGKWLLRFVPDGTGLSAQDSAELQHRLESALGVSLHIQALDALMSEGSGKFRLCYPARAAAAELRTIPGKRPEQIHSPAEIHRQKHEQPRACE